MRTSRGFTLIELLVVITIIAILAALTVAGYGGIKEAANRSRATSELSALVSALESYRVDNAEYPFDSGTSFPNSSSSYDPAGYTDGATLLYAQLVGTELGYDSYYTVRNASQYEGDPRSATTYLIDPWGYAWGYQPVDPSDRDSTPANNTGFFDLWTTAGGTDDDDFSGWIVTWPNEDDQKVAN